MIARPARSDWLLLLLLGLIWGTSYAFIKLGGQSLPTFTLIASRLGIGLALLASVVAITREQLPRSGRIYGHLLVMAVINIVIPFTLITNAERSVDSAVAAILNGAAPLVVIVVAALFLHDEPMTVNRVVGLLVGYAGVVVLVSRGLTSLGSGSFTGELALVGSTVAYGVGAVYARRNTRELRPMIPALFQVAFAFVMVSVLALAFEAPLAVHWTSDALLAVLWLGLLGSGVAYILNFRLLGRIGATRTSLVAYLLPVVGIISGALMFGEEIDARVVLGTGLVIAGVALVNSRYGQRRLFGRTPAGAVSSEPEA